MSDTKAPSSAATMPGRTGFGRAVALVRTAIYSVVATLVFIGLSIVCSPALLFPPKPTRWLLRFWTSTDLWILRLVVGQKIRILNPENIPEGPALVGSKHQSAFETLALVPMLPKGAIILKKELLKIPLYGWYAAHYGMIPVDRSAGAAALKQLAIDAQKALDDGMQIVIFPEGTRQPLHAPPDYKPGAIFLYDKLKVPMVPVALNSGVFWPRGGYAKYPGTITVSFLPAIPPGLPRAEAKERLVAAIEQETERLVREAEAEAGKG
ncbi:lysophospholipid acyltransferase family protein [Acuticoccus sediminis]|nr:1-acyl-sn-glycerol-3-phosphate acyltransferase [Acuticoccus sediminis]